MYMNDTITTIADSQPENTKEQVIWEEKESTTPTKKSEMPSTNGVCDIITKINALNESVPLRDITRTNPIKISGIYKIVNKINGKYYAGSAANINYKSKCRWWEHYFELTHNIHANKGLQTDWNLYGEINFTWLIIEEVNKLSNLKPVEQRYLDICKQNPTTCYNKNFTAQGYGCGNDHFNYKFVDPDTYELIKTKWIELGEAKTLLIIQKMGYSIGVLKRLILEFKKNTSDYQKYKDVRRKNLILPHTHNIKGKEKFYVDGIIFNSKIEIARRYGISVCSVKRRLKLNNTNQLTSDELKSRQNIRGSENPKYDHKIYKFVNNKLNTEFIGTRFDFQYTYEFPRYILSRLINNKTKFTMTGWIFLGEVK